MTQRVDVTAWPFGAKGDGATDDTAAIQGAIDWAFANGAHEVYFPSGKYKYTPPLWMDPPGNMRASGVAHPTQYGFSIKLSGDGLSGDINHGSVLMPTNDSVPALWIGTGSGMTVSGLIIQGSSDPPALAALNPSSIGIAIAGGDGGSTQTLIENCRIFRFYAGVKTGANRDSLCDSITLRKVWIDQAYIGYWVGNTQNFIDDLDECTITADIAIYNPQDMHVNVRGGSQGGGGPALAIFGISGTSGLSPLADLHNGTFSLTTTIASPDALVGLGVYKRAAIRTANFGVVPLLMVGYAAPVATFKLLSSWVVAHFGNLDITTKTDLAAELQAATQVFLAEDQTIYMGAVHATGVHIETPRPHTLLDMAAVQPAGNQQNVVLERIRYNNDPSASDLVGYLGTGRTQEAAYLIQQSHPWLSLSNYPVAVRDGHFRVGPLADYPIIDGWPSGQKSQLYFFERNSNLWSPNLRYWSQPQNDDNTIRGQVSNRYKGFGSFDASPFSYVDPFSYGNDGQSPAAGYRPAPWTTPRIRPDQFAIASGVLTPTLIGKYPLIHGDTIYQVVSYDAVAAKFVRSNHRFLSYGQNLAAAWSYKGGSTVVLMADTSKMVPGLYIGLALNGMTVWFVVTGIFRGLGYITITNVDDGVSVRSNPGDKLTVYSGATILQEPYAFTSVAFQ